jgi:hypothetical protein
LVVVELEQVVGGGDEASFAAAGGAAAALEAFDRAVEPDEEQRSVADLGHGEVGLEQ